MALIGGCKLIVGGGMSIREKALICGIGNADAEFVGMKTRNVTKLG
jgi:hypothetical protein